MSNYKERGDEADEEEMLEGVAEWDYEGDSDEGEESEQGSNAASDDEDDDDDEEEEPAPAPVRRNGARPPAGGRSKASVKASVLAKLDKSTKTKNRAAAAPRDEYDMDLDDD